MSIYPTITGITRRYLTKGATATGIPSANAGVAGPNTSGITASQSAPIAANYVLADSTIITPVTDGAQLVSSVTLCIHITSMDSGSSGRIVVWEVQSAVSGSAPTSVAGAVPVLVEHVEGGLSPSSDEVIRIPWYDIPDAMFGAAAGSTSAWYATQFLTKNNAPTTGIFFEAWLEF